MQSGGASWNVEVEMVVVKIVVVKKVVLEQGVVVVVAEVGCLPKTAPVRLFFVTDNGGDGFPFVLGRFERSQRRAA